MIATCANPECNNLFKRAISSDRKTCCKYCRTRMRGRKLLIRKPKRAERLLRGYQRACITSQRIKPSER